MRFRCLMVALMLLTVFASESVGQSKQPGSNSPSKQNAQSPAPDQRGTKQPLSVRILPATDAEKKAEQQEHEAKEKAKFDRMLALETQRIADFTKWLAAFTAGLVVIAFAQAGLFVWQLRYMRKSIQDAETAAQAAEATANATQDSVALARDEFNSVHRPKMRLKHLWLTGDIWEGEQVEATAVFVNAGLTPATLRELNIGTYIAHSEKPLPENPNWIKNQTFPLGTQILGGGISLEINKLNDSREFSRILRMSPLEKERRDSISLALSNTRINAA